MDKQEIYDEKIAPLMAQIIAIAQDHKIAMVASFAIPTEDNPDLFVSTRIKDENEEYPNFLLEMARILDRNSTAPAPLMNLTFEDSDGKKTMVTIVP